MKFKILKKDTNYQGFFKVETVHFEHELFKGGSAGPITHEIFERGDSVAVLPYDPRLNKVVLIEQFRIAAAKHSDNPWLIELIAGMTKPGELPEEVASREAQEEANCTLDNLKLIYKYLPSPGGSSEQVWLYIATTDASKLGGIHGLAEESEDIRVLTLSLEEALNNIKNGTIYSAPAMMALQWLALNKHETDFTNH